MDGYPPYTLGGKPVIIGTGIEPLQPALNNLMSKQPNASLGAPVEGPDVILDADKLARFQRRQI
jgi:hypothetical protein